MENRTLQPRASAWQAIAMSHRDRQYQLSRKYIEFYQSALQNVARNKSRARCIDSGLPIMLVEIRYNSEKELVVVKMAGELNTADYRKALEQITNSDDYAPNVGVVWGFLEVDYYHLDLAALYRFKQVREGFREKRWGAMTCVIVPDPVGGSLVEMFEEIAIKGSAHSRVVFDMNSAELWCAGS
jgi:hypothetical protein